MQAFTSHTGRVIPLDRANVDTDQILPKQFLKRIERTGFGQFLFFSWRFDAAGEPDPGFVLNEARYYGGSILIAGENFGSGSSREHAVWALADHGIRAVIAPSFADIFFNNCFKNGLLPVVLPTAVVEQLMQRADTMEGYSLTVDLEGCTVSDGHGVAEPFAIDPFRRHCLLHGLDEIALTLQHVDEIAAYEMANGR
jgi:3-isopropylmalate/(R)-2-methylmalate dehydratase small subunit